jgi:hypothetical protein
MIIYAILLIQCVVILILIIYLCNVKSSNIVGLMEINNKQRSEIDNLNNSIQSLTEQLKPKKAPRDKWSNGSTCVYRTTLTHGSGSDAHEFTATYICEVIGISELQLKVKPLTLTSSSSITFNNVRTVKLFLDYMNDKWISKDSADLVMDDRYNRIKTIEDIIGNE